MTAWMRSTWVAVLGLAMLAGVAAAQDRGGGQARLGRDADFDEDGQRDKLPQLPSGMSVQMIAEGGEIFRGKGGCVTCHGDHGQGVPAQGSALTAGLQFVPAEWGPIDSVIKTGISEPLTRVPIAMPPRGAASNLTDQETRRVAAYVWAIAQVKGEPWPGGRRPGQEPRATAPTSPDADRGDADHGAAN